MVMLYLLMLLFNTPPVSSQLHAAVVELSTAANAEIKYSTVQNWCAGGLVIHHHLTA